MLYRYHLGLFLACVLLTACKDTARDKTLHVEEKNKPALAATGSDAQPMPLSITIPEASRAYISVREIQPETFSPTVQAPARIEFRSKALSTVGAVIAGRVGKIHVQAGDKVKAGMLLASLESPQAAQMRAEIARTEDELQRAEDHAKRQEMMFKSGVGLEVERMEADIQLKEARTDYQRSIQAAQLLGEGSGQTVPLLAPVDGVVLKVLTNLGAAVESGAVLFELGEPNALRIVADVFENELPLIFPGAKVSLQIDAAHETYSGKVTSVSATVQPDLRRAEVYIDLDNPGISLKPGMFARATIQGAGPNRFVLPTTSVLIKGGKQTVVYIEGKNGVFSARNVKVGQARENLVPILEGIQAGDRVVVSGTLLLDSEAEMLL